MEIVNSVRHLAFNYSFITFYKSFNYFRKMLHLKGYPLYKTITPQNVLSEAQVRNFLFRGKVMLRSQDIQVFEFLAIPRFSKSVTS